jgi:hypothetical protein
MVGQLFLNSQLLCIYVGASNQKGWTPIAALPDGSYCLHKASEENTHRRIQVTSAQKRKPLLMKVNNLLREELTGYDKDAPLYLSWASGQQQMTQLAKQNIDKVIAAIDRGEEVHLTIFSQYLG